MLFLMSMMFLYFRFFDCICFFFRSITYLLPYRIVGYANRFTVSSKRKIFLPHVKLTESNDELLRKVSYKDTRLFTFVLQKSMATNVKGKHESICIFSWKIYFNHAVVLRHSLSNNSYGVWCPFVVSMPHNYTYNVSLSFLNLSKSSTLYVCHSCNGQHVFDFTLFQLYKYYSHILICITIERNMFQQSFV